MADQRALEAISRIEAALGRIEAAAERPAPSAAIVDSAELAQLRSAHQALKSRVAGAIGEIDRLLAGAKG